MKIALVNEHYSEGMGYTENCLPKALAALGHEIHVVTSNWNAYGTQSDYESTFLSFLGPADQGSAKFTIDGYTVHRLPSRLVGRYIMISGLTGKLRELAPDVVHSLSMASFQTFLIAALRRKANFKLFAQTHQSLSAVKPYLRDPGGPLLRKAAFRMTRTLPTFLASLVVERCYAVAPDCLYVARNFYGVPKKKLKLQSLGTDTERFRPATTAEEHAVRGEMRKRLGYADDDIVCIYTGRFNANKNPLILAKAVETLATQDARFQALFIGDGLQRDAIATCAHATILPFMKHDRLADFYRLADIAVWPRWESISMLDAAASGLPLVVSENVGEPERVAGNGSFYKENSIEDMGSTLLSLKSAEERRSLGAAGRVKMIHSFSWDAIAKSLESDFQSARLGSTLSRDAD